VVGRGFASLLNSYVGLPSSLEEQRPLLLLGVGLTGMAPLRAALNWTPLQVTPPSVGGPPIASQRHRSASSTLHRGPAPLQWPAAGSLRRCSARRAPGGLQPRSAGTSGMQHPACWGQLLAVVAGSQHGIVTALVVPAFAQHNAVNPLPCHSDTSGRCASNRAVSPLKYCSRQ
jgi:hypothetical protein